MVGLYRWLRNLRNLSALTLYRGGIFCLGRRAECRVNIFSSCVFSGSRAALVFCCMAHAWSALLSAACQTCEGSHLCAFICKVRYMSPVYSYASTLRFDIFLRVHKNMFKEESSPDWILFLSMYGVLGRLATFGTGGGRFAAWKSVFSWFFSNFFQIFFEVFQATLKPQ